MANRVAGLVNKAPVAAAPSRDERRYRAEDALRTITRAEEFKKDRSLMSDVRKMVQDQMRCVTKKK